jgi:hypothetical protein
MKKKDLIQKLEEAKQLTSVVSIDTMIEMVHQLESEVKFGITQYMADQLLKKVEEYLDYNSDNLVDKDRCEFSIRYGNTIEIEEVRINVDDIFDHVSSELSKYVCEELEEEEEEDENNLTEE